MSLLPLLLLWAYNNSTRAPSQPAPITRGGPPRWPTTSSPPPVPAFQPRTTPLSADPSHSSTPLADLHNNPPQLPKAKTDANKAPSAPAAIKQAAINTFKQRATSALMQRARSATQAPLIPIDPWASPTTSVPVAKLQEIVNARGGRLVRDGLYGPKTAAAWSKLAKAKGLTGTISRVGPNTAKVVSRTYETLAVPPIP